MSKYRKLHIGDEVWQYKIGHGSIDIRAPKSKENPKGKRFNIGFGKLYLAGHNADSRNVGPQEIKNYIVYFLL